MYTSKIEKAYPGYVRSLFCYAQKVKGAKATFLELAKTMKLKSSTAGETRPTLFLSRHQVMRWFHQQGGKEYSPKEKPLDTPEHKAKRKVWVREWFDVLTSETEPVCYIDKKWFYTTNRRRKLKKLPLGEGEEDGEDMLVRPKMRSRRFPVKSMFMGVVARPRPDKNFDGKVFLERVSKNVVID